MTSLEQGGFSWSVGHDDNTAVVVLSGEFDMARVAEFEAAMARAEDTDCPSVVVDLSRLRFMDSSGLRALLKAREAADGGGRRLMLVLGSEPIRRMFEVTRLDSHFEIIDAAPSVDRWR